MLDAPRFSGRVGVGADVCQWNDADLSDSVRLELQLQTLIATGSLAFFTGSLDDLCPQCQLLALSCSSEWEASLYC